MYKKSQLEARKMENQRKKFIRDIQKLNRKWTFIYSFLFSIWVFLGGLIIFIGIYPALVGIVLGLYFFIRGLSEVRSSYEYQMKKIEQMKQLEDRIIEEIRQQEILENTLREIRQIAEKNHG